MSASPSDKAASPAASSPAPNVLSPKAAAIDPAVFKGNTTNSIVCLDEPTTRDVQWSQFYRETEDVFGEFYTFELQQKQAAAAVANGTIASSSLTASQSQTGAQLAAAMATAITVPKGVTIPPPVAVAGGAGGRALSARQLSGQLDDEVARSWEEDWEDEDVDDGFDVIMAKIARGAATVTAE